MVQYAQRLFKGLPKITNKIAIPTQRLCQGREKFLDYHLGVAVRHAQRLILGLPKSTHMLAIPTQRHSQDRDKFLDYHLGIAVRHTQCFLSKAAPINK
jgi:hypothetical protein